MTSVPYKSVSMPSIADRLEKLSVNSPFCGGRPDDEFVDGYENPMAWVKRYSSRTKRAAADRDVLFKCMDLRDTTLGQLGRDKPEYIKWRLFGYNLVITYEHTYKGETDKALKVIGDIENILSSIGKNDQFLKSIEIALNHVILSTKSHLLKSCAFGAEFIMPNNMNQINKAGLYGIQTVFFYNYDLTYIQTAKDCALKAISLNENEAEWHFLLSRVLTYWHRSCFNLYECTKEEINAAEKAVKLGKNDVYKLHLVYVYQRMSRNKNVTINVEIKNKILNAGLKLLNDVMKNNTNDLLLLKSCLQSLSKFSLYKPNDSIDELIENLINKLKSSNNGFIHGAIGNYYLFNKKDFKMANMHLKKAFEAKSFGYSIDYIHTVYRINPESTQIEPLLVDMLKSFPYTVNQEKILSLIVSYLLLTKNDLIRSLKYVSKLLSLINTTCFDYLKEHRAIFSTRYHKPFNLIDMLSEKFNAALKDSELPADHAKKVAEMLEIVESYRQSCLIIKKNSYLENDFKKDISTKSNKPNWKNNNNNESWRYKNSNQGIAIVKSKDEGNWRSLKPDANSNIFSPRYPKAVFKQ